MTVQWAVGDAYERYVGRWSRGVARSFVAWLAVPAQRSWLDVGCGTGALTQTILAQADPAAVLGVDPSDGFLAHARTQVGDPRATFQVGDARSLPVPDRHFDAVVSGLALNFVPEPALAAAECARAARVGGVVAAYVWDYADGMAMMHEFWSTAEELDPAVASIAESYKFPICDPDALRTLWTEVGLTDVAVDGIVVPTVFTDFDDYWSPFLGGQGPAPGYAMSLDEEHRAVLRDRLHARLGDGPINLTARAWAARGTVH